MSRLKGKAVIGQSGGPTAVINETLVGAVLEGRRHSQIERFYGALHGIQGILDEEFVDLDAESGENLERVARTPSAALGSVRKKPSREDCARLVEVFSARDVRYLFYIGGNDTAETAHIVDELAREAGYELRVCHLPKTVDNDLRVTDHCPGYGSAARFVALAFMGDDLDNRSLSGVKINVTMGRHAGFLTAASALGRRDEGDGPHLIYLPEVPFDRARFCEDVERTMSRWGRCVIAVSEGLADDQGRPVATTVASAVEGRDAHGNVQLSGSGALGDFLASVVREDLGVKRVRADTFGYLQRSFPGVRSEVDASEAREAGAFGVRTLVSGKAARGSVAIRRSGEGADYRSEMFLTELSKVARETRSLDEGFIVASGNDVTPAFVEYALPLVGELPVPGKLGRVPVPRGEKA